MHVDAKGTDIGTIVVLRGAVSKELKPLVEPSHGMDDGRRCQSTRPNGKKAAPIVIVPVKQRGCRDRPGELGLVAREDGPGVRRPVSGFLRRCDRGARRQDAQRRRPFDCAGARKPAGTFQPVCVAFFDTAG